MKNWSIRRTPMFSSLAMVYKRRVDHLYQFTERFRGVILENNDFEQCIATHDHKSALFYCDPRYYGVNYYRMKFSVADHKRLAMVLNGIKGKAMVSYYAVPELDDLYPEEKWCRITRDYRIRSSHIKEDKSRRQVQELLLCNFSPDDEPKFAVGYDSHTLTSFEENEKDD